MASLGDLVVNLRGNVAPLRQSLSVGQTLLAGFAGGVGGIVAGIAAKGFGAVVGGVQGMIDGARESAAAQNKLQAVLDATGGAAGVSAEEITGLAADLQSLTNFEDDATIAAAGVLAGFTNIKGDQFKDAIISAQDLSAVFGTDLQTNVQLLGKALNDPIKGMKALRKVGISLSDEQQAEIKKLAGGGDLAGAQSILLGQIESRFGSAATKMADPFTQIQNVIGDVGEGIGGFLLPTLKAVVGVAWDLLRPIAGAGDGLASAGEQVRDFVLPALTQFKNAVVSSFTFFRGVAEDVWSSVGGTVTAIVGGIRDAIVNWLLISEFTYQNFGDVAALVGAEIVLSIVQIGAEFAHFFTGVLPGLFNWFSENWSDIWFTAGDVVLTVMANLGENIRNAWSKIWDFITSGGKTDLVFDWKPLTEGFVNTVKELPDIPARAAGPIEQAWLDTVNGLETKVGGKFDDFVADRQAELDALAAKDVAESAKPFAEAAGLTGGDAAGKKGKKEKGEDNAAAGRGSKEALSAIQAAIKQSDPAKRALKIAERQLAHMERQTAALESLADEDVEEIDL